ncbi:MAG: hypothetical protein U0798_05695 [Gemmataceae bacterium]
MANESKLGLLSGIAVVMVVAVFFQSKPAAGTAYIGNDTASASTSTPNPASTPSSPVSEPSTTSHVSTSTTVMDNGARSIWQPSEPRDVKPVSRDPLLWP